MGTTPDLTVARAHEYVTLVEAVLYALSRRPA